MRYPNGKSGLYGPLLYLYKEYNMKKLTLLTVLLALSVLGAQAQTTVQRSLYVSAAGDDNNNGRSEDAPYKTLKKAVEAANAGVIKTITVIGTLTGEQSAPQTGADEILITGKPDALAAVSGGIYVSGKVRFTHIRLQTIIDGSSSATVTLGMGVVVTNPNGHGVRDVRTLIMTDDAAITDCRSVGVRSAYGRGFTVTMSGSAKVANNKGKGVFCNTLTMSENTEISGNADIGIDAAGTVTLSGNAKITGNTSTDNGGGIRATNIAISGNAVVSGNTSKNGGGIYLNGGTFTMEGGDISGNKAEHGAGVYVEKGTFNHKGGAITGNEAEFVGGGVYAKSGTTYTAGGGKVSGNTAGDGGDDVFRQ
jgi:predicted outer membrane repeat protein